MASNYYFFLSQLPALTPDGRPPLGVAEFLLTAARLLDEADGRRLAAAVFPPTREAECDSCVYREFRRWNFALIGEIARFRAAARPAGEIAPPELPPELDTFGFIKEEITAAARAADPLERERLIDAMRFRRLDDLLAGRDFSAEAVVGYFLKLQILALRHSFTPDAGVAAFESAVGEIDRRSEA